MVEPILSITVVVFSIVDDTLTVMMQKPCEEAVAVWRLPEDLINTSLDHSLEHATKRIVRIQMGMETLYLEQVQTIGNSHRVPEQWSVSVNYYCLVSQNDIVTNPSMAIRKWIPLCDLFKTNIAFDHREIIEACLQRFQNKSLYTSLPIFLLPKEFTLTELQKTYEIVLGFKVEKKSFRRRLLDAGFLEETGNIRRASHRPAQLYRLAHPQPYFFPRIIEGVRQSN